MFSYPQRYPRRDTDRHPSGFTDIDRLDDKYYKQFRGDDNTIRPDNAVPTAPTAPTAPTVPTSPVVPTEPTVPTSPVVPAVPTEPDNTNEDDDKSDNMTVPNYKSTKTDDICDMDILEINDCHKNLKILIWFLLSLCIVICIGFLIYILSYIFGASNASKASNTRTYQEVRSPTPYNAPKRPLPDPNQPGFFDRMFGSNKNQQPKMDATNVTSATQPSVRQLPDPNRPGFVKRMFGSNNNPRSKSK
jgi:hypothetical protein